MFPYQITFLDFAKSEYVEKAVLKRIKKLQIFFHPIVSCKVIVSSPHRHSISNRAYHIEILTFIPGEDAIVARSGLKGKPQQGIYVAIRDAFDTAEHLLKKRAENFRKDRKEIAKPLSHIAASRKHEDSEFAPSIQHKA